MKAIRFLFIAQWGPLLCLLCGQGCDGGAPTPSLAAASGAVCAAVGVCRPGAARREPSCPHQPCGVPGACGGLTQGADCSALHLSWLQQFSIIVSQLQISQEKKKKARVFHTVE